MISVYIHIPFCNSICSYCDFCKMFKKEEWIDSYLDSLDDEIRSRYKGEKVKTLYIGGGTPSCLSIKQLERLFDICNIFDICDDCEISFECNSEDLSIQKLELLSKHVNRLSIGVQTFNNDLLKLLNRSLSYDNLVNAKKYFSNINIDLMYGFNEQSNDDLISDINKILELDIPHISTYSLILEPHTMLYINGYEIFDDSTEKEETINKMLLDNGYKHYEVSNYAREGSESKHNLVYWNNENYYGFGLGASGYIGNVRYDNSKSLKRYLSGEYVYEEHELDVNETMQNEFILGFRKLDGIDKSKFKGKYHIDVRDISIVNDLVSDGYVIDDGENVYINPKYLYISNEILLKFLDL